MNRKLIVWCVLVFCLVLITACASGPQKVPRAPLAELGSLCALYVYECPPVPPTLIDGPHFIDCSKPGGGGRTFWPEGEEAFSKATRPEAGVTIHVGSVRNELGRNNVVVLRQKPGCDLNALLAFTSKNNINVFINPTGVGGSNVSNTSSGQGSPGVTVTSNVTSDNAGSANAASPVAANTSSTENTTTTVNPPDSGSGASAPSSYYKSCEDLGFETFESCIPTCESTGVGACRPTMMGVNVGPDGSLESELCYECKSGETPPRYSWDMTCKEQGELSFQECKVECGGPQNCAPGSKMGRNEEGFTELCFRCGKNPSALYANTPATTSSPSSGSNSPQQPQSPSSSASSVPTTSVSGSGLSDNDVCVEGSSGMLDYDTCREYFVGTGRVCELREYRENNGRRIACYYPEKV